MTLFPQHTRWIALIRYQTTTALEQSRQPPPMSMLAINGLQDAVEALLGLVVEHRQLTVKGKDFAQLFDAVRDALPAISHHRTGMIALNTARVGYKHHGNVLDTMTIERHRASAQNFLVDLTKEALGEDFDTVGLTTLIADEDARRHVTAAEKAWTASDGQVALARLRIAFDHLVDSYVKRKEWSPSSGLFDTRPPHPPTGHRMHDDRRMNYVEAWLKGVDERLKLLMLGVDVRRFLYLDAHAPAIMRSFGGPVRLSELPGVPPPTDEVFTRCRQFVIDTALQLAADDYEFDPWSARRAEFAANGSLSYTANVRVIDLDD